MAESTINAQLTSGNNDGNVADNVNNNNKRDGLSKKDKNVGKFCEQQRSSSPAGRRS